MRKEGISRRNFVSLTALLGLSSLLGASTAKAERPASEEIKVGYLPVSVMTAIYAEAIDAWKEEGLKVKLELFRHGPGIAEAMLAGSIQAGDMGNMPMMFLARQNLPIVFLASDGIFTKGYATNRIMILPKSGIKSFGELKGKTVAIAAKGTVEDVLLSAASKFYGFSRDQFSVVFIPFPNMPQVLEMGQVDAIFAGVPFDTVAELMGARTLVDPMEFMFYLPVGGLAVNRKWAEANPEATIKLCKGWIRAGRWVNDNTDKAREVVTKALNLKPEVARNMKMPYWPRNGFPIIPGIWNLYYLMMENKLIEAVVDPKEFINRYWVEPNIKYVLPAVRELGSQEDPLVKRLLALKLPYLPGPAKDYLSPWER